MNILKGVNTKIFYSLLVLSVFATFTSYPLLLSLELAPQDGLVNPPLELLFHLIGFTIFFAVFIFLGLKAAHYAGIKLPALNGLTGTKSVKQSIGSFWKDALVAGLLVGLAAGVIELIFVTVFGVNLIQNNLQGSVAERILGSFYEAINVEIIFRLFIISSLALLIMKLGRIKKLGAGVMWSSIIISGVLFGLAQLPSLIEIISIDALVLVRVLVVYVVVGSVFGYLFWKKGLVAAMLAHFAYSITVFVIMPYILMLA